MSSYKKLGVIIAVIIALSLIISAITLIQSPFQKADAQKKNVPGLGVPIVTSGNNVYLVWPSNKTTQDFEIMFRASTDGGKTFGDKVNLSNSPKTDSQDVQIDTFGDNDNKIIVTWWERNQTSNEPVSRISTDKGQTFEPGPETLD